jgi:hypothetical protein
MADLPDFKLFYSYLDQAVRDTRSRNASGFTVAGFPYLRCDRFLYALGQRAHSLQERTYWVDLMRRYDVRMRTKEIQVLPERSLKRIRKYFGIQAREKICEYLYYYSEQYLDIDRQQPRFYGRVCKAVRVPRDFGIARRAAAGMFGYPLAAYAVRQREREIAQRHAKLLSMMPVRGELVTYSPQHAREWGDVPVQEYLRESAGKNPFRIPELSRERLEAIAWALAPVITVDTRRSDDRIGEFAWKRRRMFVDASRPALYFYATVVFLRDEPCLQVNYALWFPARYRNWAPVLTRTRFDGLIMRVTLAPDGVPLLFDCINASGSSYVSYPRQSRILPAKPRFFRRPPFVPSWLPEQYPAVQLGIRICAGTHEVEHVDALTQKASGSPYALYRYKRLEMLPRDDGNVISLFDQRGFLKSSRELLQRGRQVIKLSGRDPFTDPELYERSFLLR